MGSGKAGRDLPDIGDRGRCYPSGVPRKTSPAPHKRPAIVPELEPHKYAVAVWRRDEDGEPVYEILHESIRELKVAATLAQAAEADARIIPDAERP